MIVVSDNDAMKDKVVGSDADVNIENSIASYANQLTTEKGRTTNENHRKTKILIAASLYKSDHARNDLLKLINLSIKRHNACATGIERNAKHVLIALKA